MPDRFQNKYRIPSTRLQNWDYGWNAAYFITICTQNRECYFGEIADGEMVLSEIGKIVEQEWIKTPVIRPDMNLQMDAFIVMPNHFHAIIIIGENQYNAIGDDERDADCGGQRRDAMHCVSTGTPPPKSSPPPTNESETNVLIKNKFGPQSKNLASIVRGFKTGVTAHARVIHADFGWQSRFYDHIIRNDESFQRISKYIQNNALNWQTDKFYDDCRDAMHCVSTNNNDNAC